MIEMCPLYNDVKGANNTWQVGHFRPKSFEFAVYQSSLELFNDRRKLLGNNQDITDELRPFIKSVQIAIKHFPSGGLIPYPKDYSRFSALRYFHKADDNKKGISCKDFDIMEKEGDCRPLREEEIAEAMESEKLIEKKTDKIDSGKWASFNDHVFLGPASGNIGATQNGEGFMVMPADIGYVVLDYLAIPERPKFAYTTDANHNIICDPPNCKNLLWNAEILPELMSRIKTKYGSFVGSERKYNEGKKDTDDSK